jgi:hypothetical protein
MLAQQKLLTKKFTLLSLKKYRGKINALLP